MKVQLTYEILNQEMSFENKSEPGGIAYLARVRTKEIVMEPRATFYNNITKKIHFVKGFMLKSNYLFFDQTFLEWEATPEGQNVV